MTKPEISKAGPGGDDLATWMEKAATLSEALPYMQVYAGRTFVVKFGGHAMGDPTLADQFAHDIVLLKRIGINPIVVHGGGRRSARCCGGSRSRAISSTGCG